MTNNNCIHCYSLGYLLDDILYILYKNIIKYLPNHKSTDKNRFYYINGQTIYKVNTFYIKILKRHPIWNQKKSLKIKC